jgi:hypothetical protein
MKSSFSRVSRCVPVAILALAGIFLSAQEIPQPILWRLSVSTQDSPPLRPGSTAVAHLHAAIHSGWHLYAFMQKPGGPKPLTSRPAAGQPYVISGDIDAPAPRTAVDPNLNLETRFYVGQTSFAIPMKITGASPNGIRTISVDVSYQACNNVMCMPPAVAHLTSLVKP